MRHVKKTGAGLGLAALLCVGGAWLLGSHDDAFTEEGLLVADASDLRHTVITAHLEAPLAAGENVLWCGTFQLAWNEACALVGGDLHFDGEPAMVRALNKRSFTKRDIDPQSCVAVAGFVKDGIHARIAWQLQQTFHGRATPHYIPPMSLTPRPQDIVAYSYLFKNLEFPVRFERIDKPLVFAAEEVPCFGIGEEYKEGHLKMFDQLVILDYRSEDDFVIELRTKSERDRVILAKMPRQATLAATVQAASRRAASGQPAGPQFGDVLKVPKLNFDVTRTYGELEGRHLRTANPKVADDLMVTSAVQNVRFQLDEKGVKLRSESHIAFGCAAEAGPPPTRRIMVFDKPFLIMLQRIEADVPYFALWVNSPELLVKAGK